MWVTGWLIPQDVFLTALPSLQAITSCSLCFWLSRDSVALHVLLRIATPPLGLSL